MRCLPGTRRRKKHWLKLGGGLRQKERRGEQTLDFISKIEAMSDSIIDFRTDYWGHLVEKITVHRKGKLVFSFACGVEIEV